MVVSGIVREARNAGWTLDEAITVTLENTWQSFRADFVKNMTRPTISQTKSENSGLYPIMRDGQKVMVPHAEYVEFKNKTMRID